ncbi:MAG: hypothetical protein KGN01_06975 [Patescibacteria group bacterium]|nr:hypothetical protein [Patescibacteria group bacterium]
MKRKFRTSKSAPVIQGASLTQGQLEVQAIQKKMRFYSVEEQPNYWLLPDNERRQFLTQVFGDPSRGIPYGKIFELCGMFSGGKTALALELAAEAQADGADVAVIDLESTRDAKWEAIRGLDTNLVVPFQSRLVRDKLNSAPRMLTAEEVFEQAEIYVKKKLAKDPKRKIFLMVDSVTAIMPEREEEAGLEGGQMAMLASFMSRLLKRWVPIAWTHNVMMVLINQLRLNPGVRFGNPEYRPGGRALDFYTSVIVKVKRESKGHGWLLKGGKKIGIRGNLTNQKNKVGGQEGEVIGYKLYFSKRARFLNNSDQ